MAGKLTFAKLVQRFLAWARDALAERTAAAYEWQLERAVKQIGDKPLASLRPYHLTRWAHTWHEWQAVARCCNWAVNEAGLLKRSPFASVKPPARRERQRILSPAELVRLLRRCSSPARAFLLAMRETFARPQEIRAARWEDVQAEDPAMPLRKALSDGKAIIVLREYKDRRRRRESTRPRVLLVSPRLGRSLLRQLAQGGADRGPIWLNVRGRPWSNNAVRCLFRRLRDWLGIKADQHGEQVVPYTVRHTMATLASARGIKDRVLADILGHVETRTTRRYQHLDVKHLRDALQRLAPHRRHGHEI